MGPSYYMVSKYLNMIDDDLLIAAPNTIQWARQKAIRIIRLGLGRGTALPCFLRGK